MTSRRTARTVTVLAVTAIAAVGLAGCDGDDDPATSDAETSEAASNPTGSESPPADGTSPSASDGPVESIPPVEDAGTVETAVERFEDFMHAYGRGDTATACEIGEDAIVAGVGNQLGCARAVQLGRRINPPNLIAALRRATVDPSQVVQLAADRVEIPRSAISEGATVFTGADDSAVMVLEGSDWYLSPDS
jgi:hypothetical protein